MNPFFFGSSERQLFGSYDPPAQGSKRGVVICYPLAREYLLVHPTLRHLARMLSAAGHHVLRFDYYGTGDSAGDFTDATRDKWLADIATAIDELKDVAQIVKVSLVGMRYGAVLAAIVAARRPDIDRLVLWDPVFDGRLYLNELSAYTSPSSNGDIESNGVIIREPLRRQIEELTIASFGPNLPSTLILNTLASPNAYESLRARVAGSGGSCAVQHVPDVHVWREEWGQGGVGMAVGAAKAVTAWLS